MSVKLLFACLLCVALQVAISAMKQFHFSLNFKYHILKPTGAPLIVKSLLGYHSFGDGAPATPGSHGVSASSGIGVVLLVAVPFASAALVQFVNAW